MYEKLVDFILKNFPYSDRSKLIEYLKQHRDFNTLDYASDNNGEVVALVRFNVNNNIFEILDFVVRKDYRNKGVGRDMILRALMNFPDVKYLEFKRGVRGDNRIKKLKIKGIIKRNLL